MAQPIFIGSDHAGYSLKQSLLSQLSQEFEDVGCFSADSVDYPDLAEKVSQGVIKNKSKGILICGSGLGMCISANKIDGIRATSAWDATSARLSRQHNDANVLCLGARLIGQETALEIIKVWLSTDFEGGRHQKRVDKITQLEGKK